MTVAEFKKWLDEKLPTEKYGDYVIEYIDFSMEPVDWLENPRIDDLFKLVNIL